MENNGNKYVKWSVFTCVTGILLIAFGWSLTAQSQLSNKVDGYNYQLLEIRTQLSQIQTDIRWIRQVINQ